MILSNPSARSHCQDDRAFEMRAVEETRSSAENQPMPQREKEKDTTKQRHKTLPHHHLLSTANTPHAHTRDTLSHFALRPASKTPHAARGGTERERKRERERETRKEDVSVELVLQKESQGAQKAGGRRTPQRAREALKGRPCQRKPASRRHTPRGRGQERVACRQQ